MKFKKENDITLPFLAILMIPASNSKKRLQCWIHLLQILYLSVQFVVIPLIHGNFPIVQLGEWVHQMCAEKWIDISGLVLPCSWSVLRPVCEVTNSVVGSGIAGHTKKDCDSEKCIHVEWDRLVVLDVRDQSPSFIGEEISKTLD